MGFSAVFGTTIPPVYLGTFSDLVTHVLGSTTLGGVFVCLNCKTCLKQLSYDRVALVAPLPQSDSFVGQSQENKALYHLLSQL